MGKERFTAKFLYLTDQDDEPIVEDGFLTWYDARQKAREERGVMRQEYRLYFPTNLVSQCAAEGDLLVIAGRAESAVSAWAGPRRGLEFLWIHTIFPAPSVLAGLVHRGGGRRQQPYGRLVLECLSVSGHFNLPLSPSG